MVTYNQVKFRDLRSGRWRSGSFAERNPHFKVDTLSQGIANFVFKTADRYSEHAQEFAQDLVDYAKQNAPWNDRTGDARAGLNAEVVSDNGTLSIVLQHGVDYGIWLEIRWGGRYAIILPTVETMGRKLYDKMQGMLGDIIYYD